jgi:hypothetical protein
LNGGVSIWTNIFHLHHGDTLILVIPEWKNNNDSTLKQQNNEFQKCVVSSVLKNCPIEFQYFVEGCHQKCAMEYLQSHHGVSYERMAIMTYIELPFSVQVYPH